MVPAREVTPHELPGAACGYTGGEDIPEIPEQEGAIAAGQSDSSCLYKQPGRDSLRPRHGAGKKLVDVVPTERDPIDGTTPTREGECQSRHGVESDEGSLRLDAEPVDFPTDSETLPLSGGRFVRDATDPPATLLLQLETRPSSRGDGRVSPGLERGERLRQPPLEPHREGTDKGGVSGGRPNTVSSNMALSTMVSQVAEPASGSSTENRTPTDVDSVRGPARASSTPGRVAYLRQHYTDRQLSKEASDLLLSSWRQKTSQSYDSLCTRWISWCTERQVDPVSGPIEDVVNFLAHLYKEGYQYRSLSSYRSAIASMHSPIDGVAISQHPLVSRLLKGVFQTRPPLPSYQGTWDVGSVLNYMCGDRLDQNMSLKQLSLRTVMLLALTRPSRSADLAKLNLSGYRFSPEGVVFTPTSLAKQSRPGREIKDFLFPRFTENEGLCPVKSLMLYIEKTKDLRGDNKQLFISFIRPHNPVTSSTIARWLKQVMESAGIDTDIFKAHSVRSASTSAAAMQGVTTEDILNAADWSTDSSFRRFYYKPVRDTAFGKSVLAATNNTIDM